MKHIGCAALIGDLIGSRHAPDRGALHDRLAGALALINSSDPPDRPVSPLRITVGDEFQGTFATVGEALRAALRLRLELLPHADLRHGIGWGEVELLQEDPRVEDGSAWWAARAAIERVEAGAAGPGGRRTRTWYERAPESRDGPEPAPVNAALMCRDQLIDPDDGRSARLLRGYLLGQRQTELAQEEGISPSAVSQRVRSGGFGVLAAAQRLLGEVR